MTVDDALSCMRLDADKKAENAAYSGRQDDGGKRGMIQQIEAFEAGRKYELVGIFPDWLQQYADQIKIKRDPEYSEYQRLKEKFE